MPFLVAELGPEHEPFILNLFAAFAKKERALIAAGARPALAAAKARRVQRKLKSARKEAIAVLKAKADRHAANVIPMIKEAQQAGAKTLRAIAEVLNARASQLRAVAAGMQPRPRTGWLALEIVSLAE